MTKRVYIIGAGFSAGLGYPLTNRLLMEAYNKLSLEKQKSLSKVVKFHYPNFDPSNKLSFPNIEDLLTKMKVNRDMFDMSRYKNGRFSKKELLQIQNDLLNIITDWFHEIYPKNTPSWLGKFIAKVNKEKATIISFNWDLVLDYELAKKPSAKLYGLEKSSGNPIILKPHGSLNWYYSPDLSKVIKEKKQTIYEGNKLKDSVDIFLHPRTIKSKVGRKYAPIIVAPSYMKDFNRPIFKEIWRYCTNEISTAQEVYFLGYSLPLNDNHAEFILRCGFHNQIEGIIKDNINRKNPTGASKVFVINPDQRSAERIYSIVGSQHKFLWIPETIESWLNEI